MTRLLSYPSSPTLSGATTLPPAPTPAMQMRDFGDATATRKLIYDNVLKAANTLEPYSNTRHTLLLRDAHYADDDQDPTLAEQKQAILEGRSLSRRLKGTWQLFDNATGNIIEQRKQTIAQVPYFTPRGTFIRNGNEITLNNQLRLEPGVFSRIKENGELEAHANIMPGKGRSHRYFLDPEKGVFYMRIQQAKLPLMPLLRALGATDKQMREHWGSEILSANIQADSPAALHKYYERLLKATDLDKDEPEKRKLLADTIHKMELNPHISQRTLGQPFKNMNLDAIMATTKKLLAISRGEAEVDDRDHLAYQTIHGPEDLLAERIAKDYGGVRRGIFQKASWTGSLKHIPPNALGRQLEAALLHSGLGQALEEINPADVFDKQSRISRMGEGGIPTIDAVPDEARAVQPSHMGFLDPIRTPESFKVGVDVHIARAARKGSDGKIYAPFKDPRTGKTLYKSPQDVADLAIAFPGELARPSKRVWAMQNGRLDLVKKRDVSLVLPHFEDAFSPLGNMIPMKSATAQQRVAMGSRYLAQALPLQEPEAPLVRSGVPGKQDESYEHNYGKFMGAKFADKPGRVMAVDDSAVHVRYADGTEEAIELYHHFPYNRKTYLHQTPVVRPGESFGPGAVLARSNYTDARGTTALGRNLYTAYVPFRGKNFEDAVVISESAAMRKLVSEHMYQHRLEPDESYKLGRNTYVSIFPGKYDRKALANIDEHGLVRPGTMVQYDDPLILAARENEDNAAKVHRKGARGWNDASDRKSVV